MKNTLKSNLSLSFAALALMASASALEASSFIEGTEDTAAPSSSAASKPSILSLQGSNAIFKLEDDDNLTFNFALHNRFENLEICDIAVEVGPFGLVISFHNTAAIEGGAPRELVDFLTEAGLSGLVKTTDAVTIPKSEIEALVNFLSIKAGFYNALKDKWFSN